MCLLFKILKQSNDLYDFSLTFLIVLKKIVSRVQKLDKFSNAYDNFQNNLNIYNN